MLGITRAPLDEIQVNSATPGNQDSPAAAHLADGGALIVYGDNGTIRGNLFNASLARLGGSVFIANGTNGATHPGVALLGHVAGQSDGRTELVWQEDGATTTSIVARVLYFMNGTLTAAGFPEVIAAGTAGVHEEIAPKIAAFPAGGAAAGRSVVAWFDHTVAGSRIMAQVIQSDGVSLLGSPITVQPDRAAGAITPLAVATFANGNFVVAWADEDHSAFSADKSMFGIHAMIYDQAGFPLGDEITINHVTANSQSSPAIATLSTGQFVVAWEDDSGLSDPGQPVDNSDFGIKARVFNADGTAATVELTVNTAIASFQSNPSVVAGPNGSFVVGWTDSSRSGDPSGDGIKAQAFAADGSRLGAELQVNQITAGDQGAVNLSARADGTILATFVDGSLLAIAPQTADISGTGIQAQLLQLETDEISIAGASVSEGGAGASVLTFTATRTGSMAPVSVSYATADGSARAGVDYVAAAGVLSFAQGEATKTISVTVNGDSFVAPDETFAVNLSNPGAGVGLANASATGTIHNTSTLSIANASISEGGAGTSTLTFTATRAGSMAPVSVGYATADGTATAGVDYVAASGVLSFALGETTKTISVTINGDTTSEPDEAFTLVLSNPSPGAVLANASATGTIHDTFAHAYAPAERFFDSATGDHFYTLNPAEAAQIRATLPTYHDEGAPWSAPDAGGDTQHVYRFFDSATGAHFLTTSAAERAQVTATLPSYHDEGVAFESFVGADAGVPTLTLERFFNNISKVHTYAASAAEIASILSGGAGPGWADEGAGFIVKAS